MDKYREQRRFWRRVIADQSGHWLWIGGTRDNGYGTFAVKNGANWTQTTAHRFAYLDQVGVIPDGFEVDHLCRIRNCVRPDHLEAVTVAENRRRRDFKIEFPFSVDPQPLPIIPPKPQPQILERDPDLCVNGHRLSIVGKVVNGFGPQGQRRFTCAKCRSIQHINKRNGNAAKDRTHCPQGHPYTGENLWERIKYKNGRPYNARECRECTRTRNRLASRR